MTAIKCENLGKIYKNGKVKALEGLCLDIPEHCVFGFLGPNGAGKTTTIKILCGLMKSSSGQAWVAGEAVSQNSLTLRSKIGYLSQEPRMYTWMSAIELLDFVGKIYSMSIGEIRKRRDELLDLSGLKQVAKRRISTYSGGMIQRLGIAQALMSNPKVIFLDEPTSSLDPIGRKEVLEFIAHLSVNTTVFLSTHILEDVERICDKVGILNKGHLLIEEDTLALQKRYSSNILEIELGNPEQALTLSSWCTGKHITAYLKTEHSIISFDGKMQPEEKRELLKIIHELGLDLMRYEYKQASLEDVFVSIIEKT